MVLCLTLVALIGVPTESPVSAPQTKEKNDLATALQEKEIEVLVDSDTNDTSPNNEATFKKAIIINDSMPDLFSPQKDNEAVLQNISSVIEKRRRISINPESIGASIIRFQPFPGHDYQIVPKRLITNNETNTSLTGEITDEEGQSLGNASLTVIRSEAGIGYSGAFILHNGTSFTLGHNEEGQTVIDQIQDVKLPGCGGDDENTIPSDQQHHDTPQTIAADTSTSANVDSSSVTYATVNSAANNTPISVLVVYTPEARVAAGGTAAIQARATQAVNDANTAYQNSGVNIQLRLVYAGEVSYAESGNFYTDLYRLTLPSDGFMDEVHQLRNQYQADMVSLLINNMQYCGLGWLGAAASWADAYMFSTTNQYCAAYLTFAHELGHNMGANHNKENAGGAGAYSYSYGHHLANGVYRTIMAYAPGARIPYFSNPNVPYLGHATGVANQADNARTLNNTAATISGFRGTRYSISGQVTSNGQPVSGVTVSAGALGSRTTDANGVFSFTAVDETTSYTLTATKSGYGFSPANVSDVLTSNATHNFSSQFSPTLTDITDQTMHHSDTELNLPLYVTDPDTDASQLTFTATVQTISKEGYVRDLLGLYQTVDMTTEPHNQFVWFRGHSGQRYFVDSAGRLFQYLGLNNGQIRRRFMETVHAQIFTTPNRLLQADLIQADIPVQAQVSGNTLIVSRNGYLGPFMVRVQVSDGLGSSSDSFVVNVENTAPIIADIVDADFGGSTMNVQLQGSDPEGDALTYSAQVVDTGDSGAWEIQQRYLFTKVKLAPKRYRASRTYLITQSGEQYLLNIRGQLYRMANGSMTLVETIPGRYFKKPKLLIKAAPATSSLITLSINGSVLSISRNSEFRGDAQVAVTVSDGFLSDTTQFVLTTND